MFIKENCFFGFILLKLLSERVFFFSILIGDIFIFFLFGKGSYFFRFVFGLKIVNVGILIFCVKCLVFFLFFI